MDNNTTQYFPKKEHVMGYTSPRIQLTRLESYEQVRKGDCLFNSKGESLDGTGLGVGIVEKVKENEFSGPIGYCDGDFLISGEQIDDVVLVRSNDTSGLEILAGKMVFPILKEKGSKH